ncbi:MULTISPECIES: YusW family protein [Halobacillus]|uniref:YusW family protein n=1 Tax=Halobacillus TaxID=45667 RepID=UPI000423C0F1|nr:MULTISPECIES: YusW family protein [Halobacillus]
MHTWIMLIFSAFFLLTACGEPAGEKEAETAEPNAVDNISYELADSTAGAFSFTAFNLDVHYPGGVTYRVYYSAYDQGAQAVVYEMGRERISGTKAMNQLTPLFREMSFDEDSPDALVINDVLHIFGLDTGYEHFSLRVTYPDEPERHYESSKKQPLSNR